MPEYKFKNNDTGDEYLIFMSISERDVYIKENNVTQLIHGFPSHADPVKLGRIKPDRGFRELLKETKKANPGSNINTFGT
jgi:hypothetical protein